MKKSKNSVLKLQSFKIENFSIELKLAIQKLRPEREFKFPKYRNSSEYEILQAEIFESTNVRISNSTLCNIIQNRYNGKMTSSIYEAINKFLKYVASYTELPLEQQVLWAPDYNKAPGIFINSLNGSFISWERLKYELETQVIQGCPRIIPISSTVELDTFYDKKNHIVKILDKDKNEIGSVWLGANPLDNFNRDGLIRIGKSISDSNWVVYQVYRRFSDGSYRLIKSHV